MELLLVLQLWDLNTADVYMGSCFVCVKVLFTACVEMTIVMKTLNIRTPTVENVNDKSWVFS